VFVSFPPLYFENESIFLCNASDFQNSIGLFEGSHASHSSPPDKRSIKMKSGVKQEQNVSEMGKSNYFHLANDFKPSQV
jgi:hypothetical protein